MLPRLRSFLQRHIYYILLLFVAIGSAAIVKPWGEFPLNDDWAYAKSIHLFLTLHTYNPGEWPAMTLITHLLWGFLFVKTFGFSFLVLRASTWVSALAALWLANRLFLRYSSDRRLSFIASLTLLLNPSFYCLSNTFMTDVNFITLMLLGWYQADLYFQKNRISHLLLFFITSLLMVMTRQIGFIVPLAMNAALLFSEQKRWLHFSVALCANVVIYLVLLQYENYLRTVLTENAFYRFSTSGEFFSKEFRGSFFHHILLRYRFTIAEMLFYSFPLLITFLYPIWSTTPKKTLITAFLLSFSVIFFLYQDVSLQSGNMFVEMSVGPDTFYEVFKFAGIREDHTYSVFFSALLSILKYLVLTLSLTSLICLVPAFRSRTLSFSFLTPPRVFALMVFCMYICALMLSESFFDRYHLPLLAIVLLQIVKLRRNSAALYRWAMVPLILLGYISVFGTHDYFRTNEKKWEAYHYLLKEKKIDPAVINGGFEVNCWNNGYPGTWYTYMFVHKMDYVIQYSAIDSFMVMRNFPYQRLFPIKKDTVRILRRNQFAK